MLEKVKSGFSVTTKGIIVAVLILIMSIPTFFVENIIGDRQSRQGDVNAEISNTWSKSQTVMGPVLTIYYNMKNQYSTGFTEQVMRILPDNLSLYTDINVENRARGIFAVPVYTADIYMSGDFGGIGASNINRDKSKLSIQVDDLHGIRGFDEAKLDDQNLNMQNGLIGYLSNVGSNIPSNIDLSGGAKNLKFSIHYKLKGSQYIKYISTANTNKFSVKSNRANPSFVGTPLPDTRSISSTGFVANWSVSRINLPFSQVLDGNYEVRDNGSSNDNDYYNTHDYDYGAKAYPTTLEGGYVGGSDGSSKNISDGASFGIKMVTPFDQYQQTERSIKYGMLFIVLTFVTFFLIEVINRKQIHPFQYILVGLALGLFYLLLLSLSEHLGFGRAYLTSSVMIIGMIGLYIQGFLHENKLSYFITAALTMLYIYIYILMGLEDYALMVGSIGLFVILAVVMYISRNIDRYNMGSKTE